VMHSKAPADFAPAYTIHGNQERGCDFHRSNDRTGGYLDMDRRRDNGSIYRFLAMHADRFARNAIRCFEMCQLLLAIPFCR